MLLATLKTQYLVTGQTFLVGRALQATSTTQNIWCGKALETQLHEYNDE